MALTETPQRADDIKSRGPILPDRPVGTRMAWRRDDIAPRDWLVPVTAAAAAELNLIAGALKDYDGPLDDLAPDAFDWPATTDLMAEIRGRVKDGIGFAILDRLPVEEWGEPASRAVIWLLNCMLAAPMMQKTKGARLYDVRDTGATMQHGVRRSITNVAQEFHTDGSWLTLTPDIMGLACLRQAPVGGMSVVASLVTAHDDLRENAPAHLARLYGDYWWDRQAEHKGDAALSTRQPVFEWDGRELMARYYDDYIRNGYGLMHEQLEDAADAALGAMREIVERPENWIELKLEPGQVEFVNNQTLAHGRTGFEDYLDPAESRLLLRFWLRSNGLIELDAELEPELDPVD